MGGKSRILCSLLNLGGFRGKHIQSRLQWSMSFLEWCDIGRKSLDMSINANHYLRDMSIATSSSPVAPSYFSYYVQNSAPEVATNLGNFTAELWPLSGTKFWRLDINGAQLRRLCDSMKISPFKHFLCGKCLKTLFVQLSSVYKKSNLTLDPPRRSWEGTKKMSVFCL